MLETDGEAIDANHFISLVRRAIAEVRGSGVDDFDSWLDAHHEFITKAVSLVRVVDVNRAAISLNAASGRRGTVLVVTGGFHTAPDALKALLAGADVVHLCSVLLREGPDVIQTLLSEMGNWLEEKEYDSIAQLKGSVSQRNAPNPAGFARANYMKLLDSWEM
mgnify:CR=1 FL=1